MTVDATGFYADLRDNVVASSLQEFGFACAIWVKSDEVFDPVQGLITSAALWGRNPAFGVYGGGATGAYPGVSTKTEGKTLTRQRTKELYVDASVLGIVPQPDDLLEDENGALFEILNVQSVNPGGLTVMWRVTVKR